VKADLLPHQATDIPTPLIHGCYHRIDTNWYDFMYYEHIIYQVGSKYIIILSLSGPITIQEPQLL